MEIANLANVRAFFYGERAEFPPHITHGERLYALRRTFCSNPLNLIRIMPA